MRIWKNILAMLLEEFTFYHFFPSTGDRGFAPVDYDEVDPAFGDWEDVKRLGEKYYLMFDFMINHLSRQSKYYKDYQEKHEASEFKDFLNWDKFGRKIVRHRLM